MVATTNTFINSPVGAVETTLQEFQKLSTDEQLAALWFIYLETGKSITPAAPGAARLQLAQGLMDQVKAMSHQEQLQFMRNLVEKVNTPESRSYGVLSPNTKLAFWYRLAQWMEEGTVVAMPSGYQLSQPGRQVIGKIQNLDFNQQITLLRRCVVDMGVDAFI
ncbi:MAG: orange carotenoid protein N-terminal domain-containing protein [Halothece sp.]